MPNTPQTVAEVAETNGVSVRTVHRMISSGELRAQKLPGRTGAYLIKESDAKKAFRQREAA